MSVSVSMPQLGESVTEGTVTRWLKKEGERVEADEPLLEVSTDKVDTEIPSPAAGVLREIAVGEDETVEVGAQLAVIEEGDGAGSGGGAPSSDGGQGAQAEAPAPAQEAPAQQGSQGDGGANGAAAASAPPAPAPAPAWSQPQQQAPPPPPAPAPAPPQPQAPAAPQAPAPAAAAPSAPSAPSAPQAEAPAQPSTGGDGPYVTPLVRKLAAEHGVDLESVAGTGVGGRIRKQDVLDAARARRDQEAAAHAQPAAAPAAPPAAAPAAPAAAPAASQAPAGGAAAPSAPSRPAIVPSALRGTTQRLSRPRQVIAQRMVESLQTSAQLTTVVEADVTAIARLRARAKQDFEAREGVKLSFLPFFALAAIEALKVHPKLNAVIDTANNQVTYHDAEHLGIAVDAERGLMVPVIHNAGDLNLGGLARKIADLANRTRAGQVNPDELAGGTFTLTNTGSRGALFDTPIINQPQVGILGTGTVVKRPVVVEDPALGEVIAVRSMVYLALTYDHRLVDGADAARFLVTIKERLEEGSFEAELGL
ncbi:MAG TPA: 2-oxo acid dehydrogenase subunit E2 [Streptosporangiaceae bacterium]|nr:2-oxo acid dehydrogenase subunit E2 [Streptosporangiaceae bacterium]